MKKFIGIAVGAAFGVAFVATCGTPMKLGGLGDLSFLGDGPIGDGSMILGDGLLDGPQFDITQADANTSGTRLKQKVISTADGASGFNGWYDTMLNMDCTFMVAADQQYRCMPFASIDFQNTVYGDATCSQQPLITMAATGGCGTPQPYVYSTTNVSSCIVIGGLNRGQTVLHGYAIGAVYTGTTVFSKSSGTCQTATYFPPGPGYAYYNVNPTEVPASTFVAGTISIQ